MNDTAAFPALVDAFLECGDLIAAAQAIAQWQAISPGDPQAGLRLSQVLRLRGRHDEAAGTLEGVLASAPGFAGAMLDLARLNRELGRPEDARIWYERAHLAQPEAASWREEWVNVLLALGRIEQAREVAQYLCERAPEIGMNWFLLGLVLHNRRDYAAALDAYRHAGELDPSLPMLRNNTAAICMETGNYDEAKRLLDDAIRDAPDNALAWTNLSDVYLRYRQLDASLIAAERARALAPDYPVAMQAYSNVLKELQCWDNAQAMAERAVHCAPGNAGVTWSLAMIQLLRGDYRLGWINYEARWAGSQEMRDLKHGIAKPQWQGQDLAGKTLFVWGEQGFGDAMQFVRFLPQIAERVKQGGGRLIYCCFAELVSLFSRTMDMHAEEIVPHDTQSLPEFDYHLPLCSLPLALGITLEDLGRDIPYLKADAALAAQWRQRLGGHDKLRVGLAWSGSRTHQRNPLRAIDVRSCAQAFGAMPEIDFYNLQLEAPEEVALARGTGLELVDHSAEFISFDDTAAMMCNLDLVVTVCTSVAHLAGSLGVPAWVLLDVNPGWLWLLERTDSPWYPATRLYRQQRYGEWDPVLAQVAGDLRALAAQRSPAPILE
ncbi:tetratricopeptide repeat protein [Collimonas sp. H4R21]|uniref:Tetratricopeptide repeat protein n=1 Tax=Collimonas rhizosphaerae TaxID=3126357 RepID=A0ABU9PTR6_9BURK